MGLRVTNVNWPANRIRVTSHKTEHHEGKAERIIPLSPELRPHWGDVWHAAPKGTTHFIMVHGVPMGDEGLEPPTSTV